MNKFLLILFSFQLLIPLLEIDPVILRDEPITFHPTRYYLSAIEDQRTSKNQPLKLIYSTLKADTNKVHQTDLKGGTYLEIKRYLTQNLKRNTALQPISMAINSFTINESRQKDGKIEGRIKLDLSFALTKTYGLEQLTVYKGSLRYLRDDKSHLLIERNVRTMITAGLVYFDQWMDKNQAGHPLLAKTVTFKVKDYKAKEEGDTIYYQSTRPLKWSDFQAKNKPNGNFSAMVIPGIGYAQQTEVIKGVVQVNLVMETFLPKSACWASPFQRNAYSLNHEQRHFDIAKIVTERFKTAILTSNLTPATYEAFLSMEYFATLRHLDEMQKSYDQETNHGINTFLQQQWNDRIDKELSGFRQKAD